MLVFNCFTTFSKASGLVANADKSSMNFGGVILNEQDSILQDLDLLKVLFFQVSWYTSHIKENYDHSILTFIGQDVC